MIYKRNTQGKVVQQKDYSKEILLSPEDFKDHKHLLQVVTIPPHTRQRLHFHTVQTEVYFILEGEAIISMNGQEIMTSPGDAFICEPEDKHFVWNKTDNEFRLVVFKFGYPKEDDTEWLEE